ncbi:GNAT family N-acetyltransferase [Promicromonospora kroppenstedtii]|uniref:GNAT family N-acetyltransferase n=1 Tax=Promicromonospora kroppenstedtii TaxID=440482 RepID=A0ABW7XNT3_9MICO
MSDPDHVHTPDELRDQAGADRFELVRAGETIAWMTYKHLRPNRYVLLHTEVDQAQRGHGIGGVLVDAVLNEIRSRQGTVTAICPFVVDYLAGDERYADVIDPKHPGYPDRTAAEHGDGAIPV